MNQNFSGSRVASCRGGINAQTLTCRLFWPLLQAGFHLGDTDLRDPVMDLLENSGQHKCFDTLAGIALLKDYWAEQDRGVAVSHWQISDGRYHRSLFAA